MLLNRQCPLTPEESFVFGGAIPISQTREMVFKEFHTVKPKSLFIWFQNPLPYIHPCYLIHVLCENADTEGDLMRPLIWFSPRCPAILWYLEGLWGLLSHACLLSISGRGCPWAAYFIFEPQFTSASGWPDIFADLRRMEWEDLEKT